MLQPIEARDEDCLQLAQRQTAGEDVIARQSRRDGALQRCPARAQLLHALVQRMIALLRGSDVKPSMPLP